MIYNIHHLHCGSFCPVCAPLFGQKGWKAHLVCHCLLIETDRGLVLIDTGLGLQDYLNMEKRLGTLVKKVGHIESNLKLSAIQQIQQLDFSPNDVKHIFVTHLDFDQAAFQIFQMQQFMYLQLSLMRHNPYLLKINCVIKQTNLNNIAIGASLNIMMAKNGLIFKKSEDYLYFKMKS